MRANIRDIINATKCDEDTAKKVEQKMNELWLVDWSQDSMAKIKKAAKYAHSLLEVAA